MGPVWSRVLRVINIEEVAISAKRLWSLRPPRSGRGNDFASPASASAGESVHQPKRLSTTQSLSISLHDFKDGAGETPPILFLNLELSAGRTGQFDHYR
jgi:hypothetical protein